MAGISRVCTGSSNNPDILRYTHFLPLMRRTISLRFPWESDAKALAAFFFGFLFVLHMVIIAEDVQAVIEDPNIDNKPAEVAKLIIDLSRYWPK